MNKFVVLLNGDVADYEQVKTHLVGAQIIAVDGGVLHAGKLGVTPDIWIGDFDSSEPLLQQRWQAVTKISFPSDKNDSDGALAIKHCVEHGAGEIVLVGAGGGRSDMVAAHQLQLIDLAVNNIRCSGFFGRQEVWPIYAGNGLDGKDRDGVWEKSIKIGSRLSVVGFCDLYGVTISGVKWPLIQALVKLGSTLTLSNVVTGPVRVELQIGYGIIVVDHVE